MTFDRVTSRLRRTRRRERALRVLLVPAHRQLQHQAQQPQRGPRAAGRPDQRLDRGRAPLQRRLPGGLVRRPRGARRRSRRSPRISSRPCPRGPTPTSRTRSSPSPRRVRFVEMEYAVPREAAGGDAARTQGDGRPLGRCGSASRWRCARPPRTTSRSPRRRAATAPTSPSTCSGARPTRRTSPPPSGSSRRTSGRPHWGKVHTRDAEYFAGVYPRFGEFTALRDRLDPERLFENDYLRRVLGA